MPGLSVMRVALISLSEVKSALSGVIMASVWANSEITEAAKPTKVPGGSDPKTIIALAFFSDGGGAMEIILADDKMG